MQALSREARSNQRRLLTAFGIDTDSDLLKFNQLKVRIIYVIVRNSKITNDEKTCLKWIFRQSLPFIFLLTRPT